MKSNNFLFVLMLTCSLFFGKQLLAQTNLALTATVKTSYISSWENLGAVNDGHQPANSEDKTNGVYGNWRGADSYNSWDWVEYQFNRENHVDSVRVYWWTDNGGVAIPYDAYVDFGGCGDSLVKVGSIGIERDTYNTLVVNKKAYRIRVNMVSTTATGIIEFQVFGKFGPQAGLVPYVQINDGPSQQVSNTTLFINVGDNIKLSNGLINIADGTWGWTGPKAFVSTDSLLAINNIALTQMGKYVFSYTTPCNITYNQNYVLLTNAQSSQAYTWPKYTPTLNYNFRQEYPVLDMPTKNSIDCSNDNVAGYINDRWFTFVYGHKRRTDVTDTAVKIMLDKFNTDFAYIRDTMGWPPDKRVKDGYRSAVYLYGSGLCTDNADTTAEGGWQGTVNGYPMVLASFYPVRAFDPTYTESDKEYQTEAMIHEEIHAVLADMPGAKEAAWFQEGGNTWLQQEMAARRSGNYSSMGYLNGGTFVAPFMPIECYSGWLQDGSFGGPSAEGVNMFNGSTQICTWRNYLGGTQYGNAFPTMLGTVLGKGSIPWIWRYCPGRVLEGMADTLGDIQMRTLLTEYRAKQALTDMAEWSGATRALLDTYINTVIKAEWEPNWVTPEIWYATPYARTTLDSTGTLTPEYRTTPGWSGANQIPLKVKSDSVYVNFKPIGKNLRCQICYRDILGNPVYAQPVDSGVTTMILQTPPANDVVILVITNTDYAYLGEQTRKAHFDYRVQIDTNLTIPAHTQKRWYAWDQNPDTDIVPQLNPISAPDTLAPTALALQQVAVYELAKKDVEVGELSTIDPNNVAFQTYTLVTGNGSDDNAYFKISGSKILVKKTLLDYSSKQSYSIRVRSTNIPGKYVENQFVIPVVKTNKVNSIIANNIVQVFPNPANGSATVKLANNQIISKIEIVTLTGATLKVINNVNANQTVITNNNLANGVYYLKVVADRNYYVKIVFQ